MSSLVKRLGGPLEVGFGWRACNVGGKGLLAGSGRGELKTGRVVVGIAAGLGLLGRWFGFGRHGGRGSRRVMKEGRVGGKRFVN